MRITTRTYTSSSNFTVPAGVTSLIILGQGGGQGGSTGGYAGGGSANKQKGGYGGVSTYLVPYVIQVTPNTTYTVTIGTGGAGGTQAGGNPNPGGNGSDSSFGNLILFSGGKSIISNPYSVHYTVRPSDNNTGTMIANGPFSLAGDTNGSTQGGAAPGNEGLIGSYSGRGAAGGSSSSDGAGGAPGNSSDAGVGGAGGAGGTGPNGSGSNGSAATSTNYGAGGGGGGGAAGSGTIGNGGAGAGGRIIVMWVE